MTELSFFVKASETTHSVTLLTYMNIFIVISFTILASYYAIYGRLAMRSVMLFNVILGIASLLLYWILIADIFWIDILTKSEVSSYIIKPLYTILLSGILTNIIALGRKRDDN